MRKDGVRPHGRLNSEFRIRVFAGKGKRCMRAREITPQRSANNSKNVALTPDDLGVD
jgi:hypothetical protein